jgi:hypothetical protein
MRLVRAKLAVAVSCPFAVTVDDVRASRFATH